MAEAAAVLHHLSSDWARSKQNEVEFSFRNAIRYMRQSIGLAHPQRYIAVRRARSFTSI